MLPQAFWDKVIVGNDDDCWEWIGSLVGGYGHFRCGHKVKKAHRLSYENSNGPIPDGLVVMHVCDNRSCVNPAHLKLGSILDNNCDRDNKGRQVALKGESHGMAINNIAGIKKIRALQRKHANEIKLLASELGIATVTVRDVMNGKTWKWLP